MTTTTAVPSALSAISAPSSSTLSAPSSRSRHSLYGSEDRIILDLGSRVWKVGYSGEAAPRAVFDVAVVDNDDGHDNYGRTDSAALWNPDCAMIANDLAHLERRFRRWLRRSFYRELMADSRTRKVIVLENPLLPICIKKLIVRILFTQLSVPSISFASTPLCALLSIGRSTGLVIDVGHAETTLLPIYASRPLFSHLRTTPLASRALSTNLHALLARFALWNPYTEASNTSHPQPRIPPISVLTDTVVDEIKTRICFVQPEAAERTDASTSSLQPRLRNSRKRKYRLNSCRFDHFAARFNEPVPITSPLTTSRSGSSSEVGAQEALPEAGSDAELEYLTLMQDNLFQRHHVVAPIESGGATRTRWRTASTATDITFRLRDGVLTVPGWLRHACTDMFFDSSVDKTFSANGSDDDDGASAYTDPDRPSIPEVILDTLLKMPLDLRRTMSHQIVLIGGGSMLPGFPLRLVNELHYMLHRDKRYTPLRGLSRSLRIVNGGKPDATSSPLHNSQAASDIARQEPTSSDPDDLDEADEVTFSWQRSLLAWVGASLVGALKIGGKDELTREAYDVAVAEGNADGMVSRCDWTQRM